ncbi:MAG: GNAT family N-acetyltransferase [Phyllobacteriaceae bacterium]|nr:GNAT family N-acetyltransferase [Phyllobacteriaceae bacterium]
MIRIFNEVDAADRIEEMEQVWRLRHRVFVEEKGWHDLARPDGREIDQFDHEEAVHLCVMRGARVVAYARLLPTTRGHLLTDVLPELCRLREVPRGEDTMEWTRHCVDPDHRGSTFAMGEAERELVLGIVEWASANGIDHLTAEGHPVWVSRLLRLGFGVEPLCLPTPIAGEMAMGMYITIGEDTLEKTRRVLAPERIELPNAAIAEREAPTARR